MREHGLQLDDRFPRCLCPSSRPVGLPFLRPGWGPLRQLFECIPSISCIIYTRNTDTSVSRVSCGPIGAVAGVCCSPRDGKGVSEQDFYRSSVSTWVKVLMNAAAYACNSQEALRFARWAQAPRPQEEREVGQQGADLGDMPACGRGEA